MANAAIDENGRQSITAFLNTDGSTIARAKADPSTHALLVEDNTTGTDEGGYQAGIDENGRQTLYAESSDGDGELIALYVDADGQLLIDSN